MSVLSGRNYFVVAMPKEGDKHGIDKYLISREKRHIDICNFGKFIHSMTLIEAREVLNYMNRRFKNNNLAYEIVDSYKRHIE